MSPQAMPLPAIHQVGRMRQIRYIRHPPRNAHELSGDPPNVSAINGTGAMALINKM